MARLEVPEPGAGTGTTLSVVRLQQSSWLWTQGVDSPGGKQGYVTQTSGLQCRQNRGSKWCLREFGQCGEGPPS